MLYSWKSSFIDICIVLQLLHQAARAEKTEVLVAICLLDCGRKGRSALEVVLYLCCYSLTMG